MCDFKSFRTCVISYRLFQDEHYFDLSRLNEEQRLQQMVIDHERTINESFRHIAEAQARLAEIQKEKDEALAKAEKERLEKEAAVAKAFQEQLAKEQERLRRKAAEAATTKLQQELEQARSAETIQVQADPREFLFDSEGIFITSQSDVFLLSQQNPMDPNFVLFEDDPIPNLNMFLNAI